MAKLVFKKKNNGYVELVCILILFFVFTALSLALVIVGAESYKQIKKRTDVTFNSGAYASYIQNKVHSYDTGNIDVINKDNVSCLVLYETESTYKTYIYCYEDKLYENLINDTSEFYIGDGEVLYDVSDLEFEKYSDNILKFSTKNKVEYVAINAGYINDKKWGQYEKVWKSKS